MTNNEPIAVRHTKTHPILVVRIKFLLNCYANIAYSQPRVWIEDCYLLRQWTWILQLTEVFIETCDLMLHVGHYTFQLTRRLVLHSNITAHLYFTLKPAEYSYKINCGRLLLLLFIIISIEFTLPYCWFVPKVLVQRNSWRVIPVSHAPHLVASLERWRCHAPRPQRTYFSPPCWPPGCWSPPQCCADQTSSASASARDGYSVPQSVHMHE